MRPRFFKSAKRFRDWLHKHHATETELWIGYYKKTSARGGMTYQEAVDEALCYGWIDGVVKTIDADSYMQRWTPRKPKSYWSAVNLG
ncbi:MAG TPA: bacteriocin-protection protein, partial [Gemmatimonadales bacterium]|nr:bacteriocin-protection protein [Gemmatimonadales bacterium]